MSARSDANALAGLEDCLWPLERRDELTAALASAVGLGQLGPADRFELSYADVAPVLTARARAEAPAVLRVGSGAGLLLGIVGYAGVDVRLLAPGGTVVIRANAALSALLRAPIEAASPTGVEAAVAQAGFVGARGESVRAALLAAALGGERVAEGARLRRAERSIGTALRAAGVGRRLGAALLGYVGQLALLVALWGTIGTRAVTASSLGGGGWGWIALIALLAAVRLASSRAAGRLAIDAGAVLRERILHGLLRLDTEPLRAAGIGRLMGRVADVEAVESLALGGGLSAAVGIFELVTGFCVLAIGVAPAGELVFAAAWALLAAALAARVQRALRAWSAERLALTHDLVERMVGQRTLVAQQPSELWHRDEDRALALYASRGRALDRAVATLTVVVPRGFLIGALVILAPRFGEAALRPGAFAASLGGLLFVASALRKLAQAFPALGAAAIAWRNIGDLLAGDETATRRATVGPAPAPGVPPAVERGPLIEARALGFRYPGRSEPVLDDCALEIRRGDRVLLEGPSGGGKSTLAALLCGLRAPTSGSLQLDGVERSALGDERWRARVGAAPQFHENHVFSASLLFNLLLGRAWPPRREDVAEAEAICRELDLGPLLGRMPSGLEQLVGESGWQLSHGERGRIYIARSLLQPLDARILDESFAALDPETLERALACVLSRAETLVVIAHP
ncbi:MAG TPA: ABC transporter ATP-binding protein [Polyangia bacterium]|nr:ABC transporter ATP-binding protein [Polyangia bacterium]